MGIYLFTRSNPVFPTQHRLLAPFIMAGEASLGRPNKIIRVFHESFPQNGSSSVFFDRLNWYMSRIGRSPFDPQNPLGITELGNCARLLKIIASIPAMAPVIEHHQCLRVALLAVQNHRHAMPRLVYENLAVLFDVLTHAFLHLTNITNPVTIRGEDVIPFLACGLELIANGHIPVHIYTIVGDNINEYTKAAKSLAKSTTVQPRHHELFQGLKAGAKMEWWPTLRLMQQASPQTSSANQSQIQKLTEKWVAFGKALGLDAAQERQRHEREMRKHCSWRACQYHKEELPETKLKACAGCGETRYCGRDCQKSDWTKGAHKQRCRRLK
ncbi:hypothetical protein PENSPDRAFT_496964 [Peniophora sp. CONT]|nr:hypothetical protein PENSPDRAFT_496964 [Peniophora sp. CONT]